MAAPASFELDLRISRCRMLATYDHFNHKHNTFFASCACIVGRPIKSLMTHYIGNIGHMSRVIKIEYVDTKK